MQTPRMGETLVEDQEIPPAFFVVPHAVVPGRKVPRGIAPRFVKFLHKPIAAHQLCAVGFDGAVVEHRPGRALGVYHIPPRRVNEGPVNTAAARNADIIPLRDPKPAEGKEQIIIFRFGAVEHVGPFDAAMVAPGQLFPIPLPRQGQTRFGIQAHNKNAAGKGTVQHSQHTVRVKKNMWVNAVGVDVRVIGCAVLADALHARF
jgi:hypothetical protein